jgi:hypothetical protein
MYVEYLIFYTEYTQNPWNAYLLLHATVHCTTLDVDSFTSFSNSSLSCSSNSFQHSEFFTSEISFTITSKQKSFSEINQYAKELNHLVTYFELGSLIVASHLVYINCIFCTDTLLNNSFAYLLFVKRMRIQHINGVCA